MTNRFVFVLSFILPFITTHADAVVNKGIHLPRQGEAVHRQVVEGVATGEAGDSAVWDWSHAVVMDGNRRMRHLNLGDSVIVRIEDGRQHIYRLHGDSLLWTGMETPQLHLADSLAPLAIKYPFQRGDSITSPFYFKGHYSGQNAVDVTGALTVVADGQGTLILPDDTVPGVLRVREQLECRLAVGRGPANSPVGDGCDSLLRLNQIRHRWYSANHRYPLAETMESTHLTPNGDILDHNMICVMCAPSVQDYDIGVLESPCERYLDDRDGDAGGGSLIASLNVDTSSRPAMVELTTTADADVQMTLSDVYGRVYASLPRGRAIGGTAFCRDVDTSRLPSGDYLLHVQVGNETRLHRFSIK